MLSLTAAAALAVAPTSALAHDGHKGKGAEPTPVATVTSFADGTLTLTLTDGSTLAAKVTDRTRLACEQAAAPVAIKANGKHRGHGKHGDRGRGFGRHRHQRCGTENLTAGTKVTEAEVSATTSGAVFREVDLLK